MLPRPLRFRLSRPRKYIGSSQTPLGKFDEKTGRNAEAPPDICRNKNPTARIGGIPAFFKNVDYPFSDISAETDASVAKPFRQLNSSPAVNFRIETARRGSPSYAIPALFRDEPIPS